MVVDTDKKLVLAGKRRHKKNADLDNAPHDMADRGVILLSHIPRGFYEHQMLGFFSQFGEVTRLKLIRSRKTGGSRHFAFIEFGYKEAAEVAAETMNFYMMFRHVLRCKLLSPDDVRKSTFYRWREIYVPPDNRKKQIRAYNKAIFDPEQLAKRKKRSLEKRDALQKKLQEMGIDYDVMNVKRNEAFVPPRRSRATHADIKELKKDTQVRKKDGRCPDFDYSDDEQEYVRHAPAQASPPRPPALPETDLNETAKSSEGDDDFNVMVVDSDDSEIVFKTPPADAKIRRMALKKSRGEARNKRKNMLLKLRQSLDSDDET